MLAPPWVGDWPPLVPLIYEARLGSVKAYNPYPIRTCLDIPEFHTVAVAARPIHGGRVPLSIRHWSSHDQGRPFTIRGIPLSRNFLIRSGEGQRLGDNVLLTRAQAEHVSISSIAEELIEPVCDGICWVRALARHD